MFEEIFGGDSPNILVVGDVMLDEYKMCEAVRLSPEAPVPILREKETIYKLGGAANVAANVAALGGTPFLHGVVGNNGWIFRKVLMDAGIDDGGIWLDPKRLTTTKTRIVANGQHVCRMDRESTEPIDCDVFKFLSNPLFEFQAVVLSDYAKGMLTLKNAQKIINKAVENCIPVIVDPKPQNIWYYGGATVLTPNAQELVSATHRKHTEKATMRISADELMDKLKIPAVLATQGEKGATLYQDRQYGEFETHIPPYPVDVADITGAGDVATAALTFALAKKVKLEIACRFACYCASLSVKQHGCGIVSQDMVLGDF